MVVSFNRIRRASNSRNNTPGMRPSVLLLHLGVDGLSLTMVLLTTLLTPLAILASFSVTDRVKPYMMLVPVP